MIELWAQIERLPGYRFGSWGSVQSRWKRGVPNLFHKDWRDLKPAPQHHGHLTICIREDVNVKKSYTVGSLILEAFQGPAPQGHDCRFLDGNGANCHIENLAWIPRSEIAAARHRTLKPFLQPESLNPCQPESSCTSSPKPL